MAAHPLRRQRTTYDYAGQDPVNGYDLDGTMLAMEDVQSCEGPGSCGGNAPEFNPGGIASLGTISDRLLGKTVTRAVEAAVPYVTACGTSAAIGGITGGAAGAAVGCFLATSAEVAKRSGHKRIGTAIEWADTGLSVKGALDRLAEIGAKRGITITRIDWIQYGDYVELRVRSVYAHVR
jgi:hypothetical protein